MPKAVAALCDWATLKVEDASHIDDALRETMSDMLYSIEFSGGPGCCFILFEHQSAPDDRIAFRVLAYMVRVWERWPRTPESDQHEGLPPIFPMVLYEGEREWQIPTRFLDFANVPEPLNKHTPNFEIHPLNLRTTEGRKLRGGLLTRGILKMMKVVMEARTPEKRLSMLREAMADLRVGFGDPAFKHAVDSALFYCFTSWSLQKI